MPRSGRSLRLDATFSLILRDGLRLLGIRLNYRTGRCLLASFCLRLSLAMTA